MHNMGKHALAIMAAILGLVLALALLFARTAARTKRARRVRAVGPRVPQTVYTRARPWPTRGVPQGFGADHRRPMEIRPDDGVPIPDRPVRDRYDS
jgi:hypothetical protein